MKPYGRRKLLKMNFRDISPKKGWQNWWEHDFDDINKARERRKNKISIIQNEYESIEPIN